MTGHIQSQVSGNVMQENKYCCRNTSAVAISASRNIYSANPSENDILVLSLQCSLFVLC